MLRNFSRSFALGLAICFLTLFGVGLEPVWGQTTTVGTVTITVLDSSGAVVPNADLSLVNESTNVETKGSTSHAGTYSFEGMPIGTYRLTITKSGFAGQEFDKVVAEAGRTTDVSATLKVGAAVESVKVNGAVTPLLETTSSAISTTIDMKQIEDLPLQGRNIFSLAFLTPGYASAPSVNGGYTNTWNGLPVIAQGNNMNGVVSSSARMKFNGNAQPDVDARLEDMQEMTVDTGQVNVSEGYGQAAMQSTFVTKNGTNHFHGGVYEDFQNAAMNANSWTNNAEGLPRNPLILNDFGGNVGGPIIRNKLFFFGSFAMSKQPGGYTATDAVLTPAAQQGILTESTGQQVNLFTQVAQPNGLPVTINPTIAGEISSINSAASAGKETITSDPNYNQVAWFIPAPETRYYPALRIDYDVSPKVRINFNWNTTKGNQPGGFPPSAEAPPFPGSNYASFGGTAKWNNYTAGLGVDWTISSTMLNQFRGGYLYDANWFGEGVGNQYLTQPRVFWAIPGSNVYNYNGEDSGQTFPNLPVTTYYPVFNFSDNLTWQHSSHNFNFGVDWWREQDHYWNPPDGIVSYTLGLATGDPALGAFESYFASAAQQDRTDAEELYATLVGRVSAVNPGGGSGFPLNLATGQFFKSVGEYPLDELMKTWGWYFHDSWHVKPTLTFNYGLRWDFTGDNHDLTGAYHSPDNAGIWGPSGVGNIFNPGVLNGTMDPTYDAREHVYNPWNVSPQPEIGIAWNPRNRWGKFGDGNTVIQAGYMLRRFTEPQQYYWDAASNYGFAYYQYFSLSPGPPVNGTQPTGTFAPGSLALGNTLPPFYYSLPDYEASVPESTQTFFGNSLSGIDQNIGQPYVQQWNVGIQRLLTHDNVLSVRYIGSHTVHEWILEDPNEVNIFENGFLNQFKAAQTNLGINAANGITSFANNGYAGQVALPVFDAAFAGEPSAGPGVPLADYGNSQFINYLTQGQAGALANTLSGISGAAPYFCNLVGASFGPCASQIGYTGAGAGYPINYFQANPFWANKQILYMTDAGYGNYNALQVEFRQNPWHGMEFEANYTYGHALGVEPNGQWQGYSNFYTLRDPRTAYGPNPYDIRHVVHVSGTYDLPFGSGRTFLNSNNFVDRIVGGWSLGTIVTYETGSPFTVNGGYNTFNDYADGGVVLHNVTPSQLQSAIGTYAVPGSAFKDALPLQYLSGLGGAANPTYLTPNETPGTFGQHVWLYGPHFFDEDFALTKSTHINERLTFVLQGEFLNAFNHPNWGVSDYTGYHPSSVLSPGFAQAGLINVPGQDAPRALELRARLDF